MTTPQPSVDVSLRLLTNSEMEKYRSHVLAEPVAVCVRTDTTNA